VYRCENSSSWCKTPGCASCTVGVEAKSSAMALAAGGRDSVEVRDMAASSSLRKGLRKHKPVCGVVSVGLDAIINPAGSHLSAPNSHGSTPTPVMFSLRSALTNIPRASRLTARPVVARAYHEKVISHYEQPRNVGSLPKNDIDVGTGLVGAPACGDVMKLQIRVDDNGIISDVKFKTFGCGSAIASSSYMTERVKGLSLEDAGKIKNTEIAKELALPPVKLHCSMLAEDAIRSAIKDYRSKRSTLAETKQKSFIDVPQSSSRTNVAESSPPSQL